MANNGPAIGSPPFRNQLFERSKVDGKSVDFDMGNISRPWNVWFAGLSSFAQRGSPFLTPEQFGAVGDGSKDDTNAWTDAIAAAISQDLPIVATGTYLVSKQGSVNIPFWGVGLFGYVFLITSPVTIVGSGTFTVDVTDTNVANVFVFQNTEAVRIGGIGCAGIGLQATQKLGFGAFILFDRCKNCRADFIQTSNMRSNTAIYQSDNCSALGSFSKIPTPLTTIANSHFVSYGSNWITFDDCTSYGGTHDCDFMAFGGPASGKMAIGNRFINCKQFSYAYGDATKAINFLYVQGFGLDSSQSLGVVQNCYAYGCSVGIDIKTTSEGNAALGNTVEKCAVGIAARRGEGNQPTYNTLIQGNIIRPMGGNGYNSGVQQLNQFLYGGVASGLTMDAVGIYLEDAVGVTVDTNTVEASIEVGSPTPGTYLSDFIALWGATTAFYSPVTSADDGMYITNNRFSMEANVGGIYVYSLNACVWLAGVATNLIFKGKLSGNDFKLTTHSGMLASPVQLSYAQQFSISDNDFTRYLGRYQVIVASNVTQLAVNNNNLPGAPGFVVLNSCADVSVNGNRTGIEGRNLNTALPVPMIYANTVNSLTVIGHIHTQDASVDDGPLVSSSSSGNGSLVIQGCILKKSNNLGTNDWYSWNGVGGSSAQNVCNQGNLINSRLMIGSALQTRNYAFRATGGNWVRDGVIVAALAAATSQTILLTAVDPLPNFGKILFVNISPVQAFAGAGFTSVTVTVGDQQGTNDWYTSVPYDLMTAAATAFRDYFSAQASVFQSGSNPQVTITANQNLNTNTLTGAFTVTIGWINIAQPNFTV
jgi:hypothetical protein